MKLSRPVSSFIDPDDGINSSDFPTADLAQVSQGINSYVEIGTSEITLLGAAGDLFGTGENISLIYDPTALVSEFPLTYNTSYSASYGLDITFSNPNLMVDSIRIKTIVMEEVTIDGWGTAILPSGSYDCLREKTISTSIDSSWVYFFGQAFLTTDSIVETNYAWLAAESKGLLVNTILNEEGDSLLGVTFFDSISVVQVAPVAAFPQKMRVTESSHLQMSLPMCPLNGNGTLAMEYQYPTKPSAFVCDSWYLQRLPDCCQYGWVRSNLPGCRSRYSAFGCFFFPGSGSRRNLIHR
jgi:hypothetical protein